MKLIIAGSRNLNDYNLIDKAIAYAKTCSPPLLVEEITEVVSGKAPGIDNLGETWAKNRGIHVEPFPAKWKDIKAKEAIIRENKYGKYNCLAGFWRNEEMAKYADALLAIARFPSSGTEDMIDRAKNHGLLVWVYEI